MRAKLYFGELRVSSLTVSLSHTDILPCSSSTPFNSKISNVPSWCTYKTRLHPCQCAGIPVPACCGVCGAQRSNHLSSRNRQKSASTEITMSDGKENAEALVPRFKFERQLNQGASRVERPGNTM